MAGNTVDIKFNSNLEDIAKDLDLLKQKIDGLAGTQILDKNAADATKSDIKEINDSFASLYNRFVTINNSIQKTQIDLDNARKKADSFRAALEDANINGGSKIRINRLTRQLNDTEKDITKYSAYLNNLNNDIKQISITMESLKVATTAAMNPEAAKEYGLALREQNKLALNNELAAKKETEQIANLQAMYRRLINTIDENKGTLSAEDISKKIREVRDQLSIYGEQEEYLGMANLQSEVTSVFDKLTQLQEKYNADEKNIIKQRSVDIKGVFDSIKQIYHSVTSAAKESVDAFRNGIKTIKSEASQLAGILGVEEYASSTSQILKGALTNASALVESQNLLNQMFEKDISLTIEWADKQSYAYGLASNAARTYLSQIGGMLQNTGIENEELVETMTLSYTKLAGDLASAFNTTTDTAFYAIRSGIAGMSRPLEKFGINLKMNTLQQWMDSKGIEASYIKLSEYNKQMVRYAYIMEQTKKIHGDYSETFSSFANMTKTLKNEWQNFLDLVGKYAVPVFKPVVMWLLTAIEYAKEFINIFAELMGLEPYDFEHAGVQYYNETESALENEEEQQKDITKAVEDTNKARKKGVKLLDLYELDFGEDTKTPDVGDTGAEIEEAKLNFEDLIEDYGNFKPDFDIKVDYDAVKKAAEWVKKLWDGAVEVFDAIWNFKLGPLPSLSELWDGILDKLKNDPIDLAKDIFGLIFADNMLKKCTPIVSSFFQRALTNPSILTNPTLKDRLAGLGVAFMGLIMAGMGGYNIGQAIIDGNSVDQITGAFESISGIITTTLGGFMMGGPVAGAIAFALSFITTGATTIWGIMDEAKKHGEDTYASLKNNGIDFSNSYSDSMKKVLDAAPYTKLEEKLDSYNKKYHEDIDPIINTEIPKLIGAYTDTSDLTEQETIIKELEKDYGELYDAASTYKSESFKAEIDASFSLFALGAEKVGTATQAMEGFLDQYKKDYDAFLESQKEDFARLSAIVDTKGIDALGDAEKQRYENLKIYLDTTGKVQEELAEQNKNIFYSVGSSVEEYAKLIKASNNAIKETDTAYNSVIGILSATGKYTDTEIDTIKEQLKQYGEIKDEYLLQRLKPDELNLIQESESALYLAVQGTKAIDEQIQYLDSSLQTSVSVVESLGSMEASLSAWQGGIFGLGSSLPVFDKFVSDLAEKISGMKLDDVQSAIDNLPEGFTFDKLGEKTQNALISAIEKGIAVPITDDDKKRLAAAIAYQSASMVDEKTGELLWNSTYNTILPTLAPGSKGIMENIRNEMSKDLLSDLTSHGITLKTGDSRFNIKLDGLKTIDSDWSKTNYSEATEAQLKGIIEDSASKAAEKTDTSEASKTTADKYTDGVESEMESEENIDKVAAGTSAALAGATNTDEATNKGKELGSAYISGLASAIAAGNQAGSPYKTALEGMVNAFKDALKDIGGAINTFAHTLSSEVDNMGISDDVTFSSLLSIIKTKGSSFNAIPKLASGAVIPPNNPFLAVLGDQRNGYNVEAPVSVIQEAVREANAEQETNVDVHVYLGNTEFRDYIVDTVIDSNLVTG